MDNKKILCLSFLFPLIYFYINLEIIPQLLIINNKKEVVENITYNNLFI
ncbi:hypothetical protein C7Y58_01970 [Fusobacterium nucleatum subsp. nucleatum ATCC 25586]|uniref:Uncharacterized protein n=1 Tax=Fusobacterium nucleatum subsp. nucleatum (strain ATCC 25586 / DSM 15643 / BCRC 10681 / CIP 101130 / JCM 8532 / KCTC 2640 / LMG 13131 / VPI 4355) TaxID=190304 RepID=Q8RH59_FUSNN|nr:unknown [Fusobacterium nucleatum subsp. nucleatum ATCC 25586]AVQ14375.1 hypothetical protein C7Y58_01970 [Fusobacterium nucleatum subsp. nucleatum ATCC 25586]AVQ22623.1 hypothetical protein C4N14_02590 [Fusobacterium nucleatum subsp. nucleatum ATCC 23726]